VRIGLKVGEGAVDNRSQQLVVPEEHSARYGADARSGGTAEVLRRRIMTLPEWGFGAASSGPSHGVLSPQSLDGRGLP
jgi:hypothetical protein